MVQLPESGHDVPFKRGRLGKTTLERSELMGRVRQRKTDAEEAVGRRLRARGIAYRRNDRRLPGSPDFANRRAGFALFVHGCFWHRHPGCRRTTTPARNRDFWEAKFARNVARDKENEAKLRGLGLKVLVIWECETEPDLTLDAKLDRLFGWT
jgi:DNA mismatch endonuclease (patch repair protein)